MIWLTILPINLPMMRNMRLIMKASLKTNRYLGDFSQKPDLLIAAQPQDLYFLFSSSQPKISSRVRRRSQKIVDCSWVQKRFRAGPRIWTKWPGSRKILEWTRNKFMESVLWSAWTQTPCFAARWILIGPAAPNGTPKCFWNEQYCIFKERSTRQFIIFSKHV